MKKVWSDAAWEDYLYWQTQDKKTLKKIIQSNCLTIRQLLFLVLGSCFAATKELLRNEPYP